MDELHRIAKRARNRLWFNRWLATLGWCVAAAAGVFLLAVVLERAWLAIEDTGRFYRTVLVASATGIAFGSVLWATLTRASLVTAAARFDEAAGLRERLSSALHVERSDDPFARAVVQDAARASRGRSVHQHLPVQVPSSANYAGGVLVVALLAFWLMPAVDLSGKQEEQRKEQEQRKLVDRTQAAIQPVLQRQLDQIRQKHPEVSNQLGDLEPLKDVSLKSPLDVRQNAIKQINRMNTALNAQREDAGRGKMEAFKTMARRMAAQHRERTPVTKLANALASGDFDTARKALEEVQSNLSESAKTPEDKKKADELRQQLDKLASQLDKAARNQEKMQQELKDAGLNEKQIAEAMKQLQQGDMEAVEEALKQQGMSQQQAQNMAQKMQNQCSACNMASQLAQTLGQASQAGSQASGSQSGQMSQQASGMGSLGQGQGNIAPEEETQHGFVNERTPVNTLPGSIISMQFIDGEQISGEVTQEAVGVAVAKQTEASDAMEKRQVPRIYHSSVRKYLDHNVRTLREQSSPEGGASSGE